MTIPKHCAECKYFAPGRRVSTEPHDGTCRFGPPGNYSTPHPDTGTTDDCDEYGNGIITMTYVNGTYTGWPVVQASDWCGCYEPTPRPRTRKPKEPT